MLPIAYILAGHPHSALLPSHRRTVQGCGEQTGTVSTALVYPAAQVELEQAKLVLFPVTARFIGQPQKALLLLR